MRFKYIEISNFRNFDHIKVELGNKNVFFGMNDIGKSNLMHAIRLLLDRSVRRNGVSEFDFHQKNVSNNIVITMCLDVSDEADDDNQKIYAKMREALLSEETDLFIRLEAEYNAKEEIIEPHMQWGGNEDNLFDVQTKGTTYAVDSIFNVIYIDAYVDMYDLFKKNIKKLIPDNVHADAEIMKKIDGDISMLNDDISSMNTIKEVENRICEKFNDFRKENINIVVKSEMAVNDVYTKMVPYIQKNNDDRLYPTSGEGRKKLLAYTLFGLLSEEKSDDKVNVFIIEEPENHLHRSLQICLSRMLFMDKMYNHLFLTTHSQYVLDEMDDVNLVRIYNENKATSASYLYKLDKMFRGYRKILQHSIAEAIFADRVLLVEGPSEELLFKRVLYSIDPYYEANGIYVLAVNGILFERYYLILNALQIEIVMKTDNDLRKIGDGQKMEVLGFERCNKIIKKLKLSKRQYLPIDDIELDCEGRDKASQKLYDDNEEKILEMQRETSLYISRVDLENDLKSALSKRLDEIVYKINGKHVDSVEYMKSAKRDNMAQIIEYLTDEDCGQIFNSKLFACLKRIME